MLVIGLDVGTTGTKALVVDESGRTVSSAYREYELSESAGGRVTQNAEDWWLAAVDTVRCATENVCKNDIAAISLSTQGASMLAADRDGKPLCDVMTWMDSRATKEVEALSETLGRDYVYEASGWPLTPAGDAAKILWLKNNAPEVFGSAACFPSTLEFMNHRLTGRFVADPTNAAIRQLYNIKSKKWDEGILDAVGVTADRLPEVEPTGVCLGALTANAARELGLPESVRVFNGAHDQYASSIGSGATAPGDMMLATGTAWVVLGVTSAPLYTASRICPGIHPAGGYGAMASLVSAGSALKWYKNLVGDDFRTMDKEASLRAHSAKDVIVLPYVAGAGFPHNRPDAGGVISGFRIGTDRYDVARAVMEGVAFEARGVIESFAAEGMKIDRLMVTGGAARSDVWSTIVGEVTKCEIQRPSERETCCLGAADIALAGLGVYRSLAEASRTTCRSETLRRDGSLEDFYDEKYALYRDVRRRILGV